MLRRSWVEIDLHKLINNYRIYRETIDSSMSVMAVIKADAYGHGDTIVAECLSREGVENFAVSNYQEALRLRENGVQGQILILGYTPIESINVLYNYDITQTVLSEAYAEAITTTEGHKPKVQFAIDTGMNRIGLDGDDPCLCERIIRKYQGVLNITGIFTHLCVADTEHEDDFTKGQINKFKTVVERISDLKLPFIHCLNSAGGLWQQPYGNIVRLGIILYGLKPDKTNILPNGIYPALSWHSVVSMIKTVHEGETIGYGRSFMADKDMTVATIPTGYADGYNRLLSNVGFVYIHGKKAPIVGRICMDQFMVDVTDIPETVFEDEVILIGDNFSADDMADLIGSIGYEVVCNISKRVDRKYIF